MEAPKVGNLVKCYGYYGIVVGDFANESLVFMANGVTMRADHILIEVLPLKVDGGVETARASFHEIMKDGVPSAKCPVPSGKWHDPEDTCDLED